VRVSWCIALASMGAFCPPHAAAIHTEAPRTPRGDDAERRSALRRSVLEMVPSAESCFVAVEVLPLVMPALLDFQFHSPDAILVLNADLSPLHALRVTRHQQLHVEQQRQRFRCRRYAGRIKRTRITGVGKLIAPWDDVEASSGAYQLELSGAAKTTLVCHTRDVATVVGLRPT